jgi:phosphatidylserine/phosphatidylglycerophosphate/cardiolipin synthase-like enzyme
MANTGVAGQIIDAVSLQGIPGLTVRAVDFDPFFHEDDVLAHGVTGSDGKFSLTYPESKYSFWKGDRKPDIVVQVFGPAQRLLHETAEVKNVTDTILQIPTIKIHPDNINGWLVTHTTLNPEIGTPVNLFPNNHINHLVDGDALFPAVTQAAKNATHSIKLMNLAFDVGNNLITEFKSDFDPLTKPPDNCKSVKEETLEEVLKQKTNIPIHILVANIPLTAEDTVTEVRDFFKDTPHVKTSDFRKGFDILHAKAVIYDGSKAILMGSPLKQYYFNDAKHAIKDARHKGSLIHDVSIEIEGPAVAHLEKTFTTLWKSTGKPLEPVQNPIPAEPLSENTASVQVLRTLPGNTFKKTTSGDDEELPYGETGILEAYQRAINNAERYIYIETQYFTSPEIVDSLIARLKDTTKPKLQLIFVINLLPDLPGYPDRQIDVINQLKIWVEKHGHQMGVYTMWSRSEASKRTAEGKIQYEIMNIYVHSKMAIIDDTWATVGTANLDGTSLNYHEVGLLVTGYIAEKFLEKINLGDNFGKFLWDAFWLVMFFVLKQIVFSLKTLLTIGKKLIEIGKDFPKFIADLAEQASEIPDLIDLYNRIKARTSQHALPNRPQQPGRSVEVNVVMYNGIAGQPASPVIKQLRERLWTEHLGLPALPADMQDVPQNPADMKWVDFWNARAKAHLEAIKKGEALPNNESTKILAWTPETSPERYLKALKVSTKNLRNRAQKYDFGECEIDDGNLLPWPII